jgi:hypothetical protein
MEDQMPLPRLWLKEKSVFIHPDGRVTVAPIPIRCLVMGIEADGERMPWPTPVRNEPSGPAG